MSTAIIEVKSRPSSRGRVFDPADNSQEGLFTLINGREVGKVTKLWIVHSIGTNRTQHSSCLIMHPARVTQILHQGHSFFILQTRHQRLAVHGIKCGSSFRVATVVAQPLFDASDRCRLQRELCIHSLCPLHLVLLVRHQHVEPGNPKCFIISKAVTHLITPIPRRIYLIRGGCSGI